MEDSQIFIKVQSIIHKNYSVVHLTSLEDIIVNNYNGQQIVIFDDDGNNIGHPQFIHWLDRLRTVLNIPYDKIIFQTQVKPPAPYQWEYRFDNWKISKSLNYDTVNKNLDQAKFVGCLAASRPSMARARLIYELDKNFPGDAFITCNRQGFLHVIQNVGNDLGESVFSNEIDWFKNRIFDNDLPDENTILNMVPASEKYIEIWNRFKIEVVCETDEYINERFTDKVAKVLTTGKPFLLLCGQGSLQYLRDIGFTTFHEIIDESYDKCVLPAQRINAIIQSLKKIYCSPDRDKILQDLYKIAYSNVESYKKLIITNPHNSCCFPIRT